MADLTPFAGMPMPPPPEFLAERYREATSLARVLWKRPYDLKLHEVAAPHRGADAACSGARPTASSRSSRPPIWADYIANAQVRTIPGVGHLIFDESAEAAAAVAEHMGAGVPA